MTALAAINLSYLGNGPSGGGQIIADSGKAGVLAKTLYGYGVIVNDSTASATNMPVNFIDGTQSLGRQIILQLQSADVQATYQGVANIQFFHSVGADSQLAVGDLVTVTGMSSANNVGPLAVKYVTASSFALVNASGVAEVNPLGLASATKGGIPFMINCFVSATAGDTTAADILCTYLYPSAITNKGFTLNFPTLVTSASAVSFGAVIAFSS